MNNLGERLFELRKTKNLSQEEVAEKLNVTRQTVSKWETNQSTPDFDKIIPLCELFEISTDELLTGIKKETKKETKKEENEKTILENEDGSLEKNQNTDRKTEDIRKKSAEVVSTSVFTYIVSVAVFIVMVAVTNVDPVIAVAILLCACAWATARIIKNYMSIPKSQKIEEKKLKGEQNEILKAINAIIWCIITAIYLLLSFTSMAWHITWIIFIIGAVITEIIRLIFLLKEDKSDEE